MIKKLLIALALVAPVYADQVASQSFKGINNNENSLIINPEYAQDALNVDVTPGGKSVKKRPGYGLYKTLGSGKAVHGGYHFFDSTGNDIQVWGSSVSLYGIVADATATRLVSSATAAATWDCADTQGNAYCVNSSRDAYIKTNGTTMQWFTTPLGTMVESTPDRIAVAGVSGSPNSIFFSGSNAFTNFTAAPLTTDPFTEVIAAPGSKITHLRWGCGKLLWWKDQSFGWFDFDDQYSASVKIISDNIGTFDNTSAIDPGGSVWFRGQDGHIYEYNCSGLVKQSIEITPFVQASGRRVSNSWTQTSQSDFQSGSILPTNQLSTTISPGDVIVSSFTRNEYTTTAQWSNGSASNLSVGTSSITLNTDNLGTVTNPDFESAFAGNWISSATAWSKQTACIVPNTFGDGCTITPQNSSNFGGLGPFNYIGSSGFYDFVVLDTTLGTLYSIQPTGGANCAWNQNTITIPSTVVGKRVRYGVRAQDNAGTFYSLYTTDSYIAAANIKVYWALGQSSTAGKRCLGIDNISNGSSTITSGSFTSQVYDTGFASATYLLSQVTYTVNSSTPSFAVITATAPYTNSLWSVASSTTGTSGTGNRYVKLVSTISVGSGDNALTYISSWTILGRSSGTYYSPVNNAPNIVAWNTFTADKLDNNGTNTFYVRASSWAFPAAYLTPSWVAQTPGGAVATSTGTYMQVRDDFTITSATDVPTLNAFTINWWEGSATDQSYGLYFDNAIYFSVAYGVGVSSNTYIFKRDLINDGWTVYGFGAGGMLVQNNHLFFGDVADTGQVFQYGSGTSDNGTAITAYWKTKDYAGQDPFLENSYTNLDSYWARNANQSATVSYIVNGSTSATSYSVSLSSTTQSIVRSKKNLPTGTNGSTINLKFGDTSSTSAWELFLYRLLYTVYPYKPG